MRRDVYCAHIPVLAQEALRFWVTDPEGFYVDLTLGLGGHSEKLLEQYPKARLLALDWDSKSLEIAKARLEKYVGRAVLEEGNFSSLKKILEESGGGRADGVLFDLGPSAFQILGRDIGLSYQKEAPLDMRYGPCEETQPTAARFLEHASSSEIQQLLVDFGELGQNFARRLARAISEADPKPKTTRDLVAALGRVTSKRDIWARVFQALRIFVNREMENLDSMLADLPDVVRTGGRVAGISFHSLEDRAVKTALRSWQKDGLFKILTKPVVAASCEEVASNPRSRSAKLRAAERI